MSDRTARVVAAVALGCALTALVLSGYAVILGNRYLEEVRTLGQLLERASRPTPANLGHGPPPNLDTGDE
ncbi:MAG: hypothetical protein U0230_08430 [Polyangiales bacterium]